MNNLQNAKILFNDAEKVRTHIDRYREVTKPPSVENHNNKFISGTGDRFNAQQFTMYLECYKGFHGSSRCPTIDLGSNKDDIMESFVLWANKNMQLIFDGIADELKIKANKLKDDSKAEIDNAVDEYNKLFSNEPPTHE